MPQKRTSDDRAESGGGYGQVLRDRPFLIFCGAYTLLMSCVAVRAFLPIYAKENFGVPESQYGLILSASSAMSVLFQYSITRTAERYPRLRVLVVGALFYALGVGSIAWGWSFWTFLASSLVVTLGVLIVSPAASAFTADLASPDMRGRYMGVFNLALWIGVGIGPVVGGLLNDHVAPVATWYGGLAMGLGATLGFVLLARIRQRTI
jgi:MFS family permease